MSKRIIDLPTGSISDTELTFIGDPNTGALTENTYLSVKNYVLSGSFLLLTGSYVTTSSFNTFSSSYHNDSSSFNNEIQGLISSQSGDVGTGSFNTFTASYYVNSASFVGAIQNISGSMLTGSYVTTLAFSVYSASYILDSRSFGTNISNTYASESNYTSTASFNTYSSSYVSDSSSFNLRINNTFASESNYTSTGSFNTFSSSYVTTSASVNTSLTNIYASESGYLATSSMNVKNNYVVLFTGSNGLTFSNIYQSGSAILINQVVGNNNAILQVAGPLAINDTSYILLPVGSTAQRLTGSAAAFGMIRANSDSSSVEYYNGAGWSTFGISSGSFPSSSVTSVALLLPSSVFNVSGSPGVGVVSLSASLNTQNLGLVFASPSGSSGVPTFRALSILDIAPLTASFISGYVLTSSFNPFTASYHTDSSSFLAQIANVYASESNYETTASFNTFSSSYHTDSSSFLSSIANVYASESNYTTTASFNTFSSSYVNASASFATNIANTYASESGYHLTSSITGAAGYLTLFTSPLGQSTSSVYQSGSLILIGSTTASNNASLQVFGGALISGGLYDSTGVTGSQGSVLSSTPGGTLWVSTGSGGWLLAGNTLASGSFLGSLNAQDVIIKRNNTQMAQFTSNNNVVLGNANNSITGSNAIVLGGTSNFANNMAAVIVGSNNTGSGNSSVVVGGSNGVSQGIGSVVLGGTNLSASAAYSVVLGRFNNPISSSTAGAWVGGDPVLIVGNGSSTSSLSNALVLFKTGSLSLPYYANSVGGLLSVDSNGNVGITPDLGVNNYIPMFSGSTALITSSIYESGSILVLGNTSSAIIGNISNIVSGSNAMAFGSSSIALANNSTAFGQGAYAYNPGMTAVGYYNIIGTLPYDIFVVGSGTSGSRQNQFLVSTLGVYVYGPLQVNSNLFVTGALHLSSSLVDNNGSTGTPGQVLSSTATGVLWQNVSGSLYSVDIIPLHHLMRLPRHMLYQVHHGMVQ